MKAVAYSLLAWLVFAAVLAFGALAIVLVLVAAPAVLFAARLVGGQSRRRWQESARGSRGSVYEGECHVLDESSIERSS